MLNIGKIKFELLSKLRGIVTPFERNEVIITLVYNELLKRNAINKSRYRIKEFKNAKLTNYASKLFEELNNDEIKEVLLSILDDAIREFGKRFENTPSDLNRLIFELFEFEGSDMFADLGCGNGTMLADIQFNAHKKGIIFKEVNGVEINSSDCYVADLLGRIYENDCCNIRNTDALKEQDFLFNKGYCYPPIGVKTQFISSQDQFSRYGYKFNPRNSSEWIFVDRMLRCLELEIGYENKKGIALLTPRCFYNDEDKEYRDLLLRKGKIHAIIELPCGVLKSTTIKSCLVIFSNGNKTVKIVDASKVMGDDPTRFTNAQLPIEAVLEKFNKAPEVDAIKLIGCSNLLPSSYLLSDKVTFSGTQLSELANIITGCQYTLSHFEPLFSTEKTGYKILTSSDINDGNVKWNNLHNIKLDDKKLEKYVVQRGDVILTSKSSKVKTVVVDEDTKDKIIVTGGMLIIRPTSRRINSTFIKIYLDSPKGKLALKIIQKGAAIITINAKDLATILIPNMSLEKQNNISKKYLNMISSYNALKESLRDTENSINNLLMDEMEGDL